MNKEIVGYCINEGVLFQRSRLTEIWRLVIPDGFTKALVDEVHKNLGHVGMYKIIKYLDKLYFWKGMYKEIKRIIKQCDLCQKTKPNNVAMTGKYCAIVPSSPHQLVTVDLYGPLPKTRRGMQYLFVIMDAFSKYVALYPIKKANASTCVRKFLKDYIPKVGKPQSILSDHGTQFTSKIWKEKIKEEGIKLVYSSIRHPQSNPTERVMRELGRMLRAFCCKKHTAWINHVDKVEKILNITAHYSTGFVPYELQYGKDPILKIKEIIKYPQSKICPPNIRIQLASDNLKRKFEQRKKGKKCTSRIVLELNDQVLLRVPHISSAIDKTVKKFFHLYEGPYRISKVLNNTAFQLCESDDQAKIKGIFNRQSLKKYYKSDET